MAWILDLDGVVWLGDEPIPGASDAVAALRDRGEQVLFVSNNSSAPIDSYLAKLAFIGVPAEADDLLRDAETFLSLAEEALGVTVQPVLPLRSAG